MEKYDKATVVPRLTDRLTKIHFDELFLHTTAENSPESQFARDYASNLALQAYYLAAEGNLIGNLWAELSPDLDRISESPIDIPAQAEIVLKEENYSERMQAALIENGAEDMVESTRKLALSATAIQGYALHWYSPGDTSLPGRQDGVIMDSDIGFYADDPFSRPLTTDLIVNPSVRKQGEERLLGGRLVLPPGSIRKASIESM
jgi:hypothetical protein